MASCIAVGTFADMGYMPMNALLYRKWLTVRAGGLNLVRPFEGAAKHLSHRPRPIQVNGFEMSMMNTPAGRYKACRARHSDGQR
jgi:hypothetical protein